MLEVQLKEFTKESHALLEKKFLQKIEQIKSEEDCARWLLMLYGFYRPIELALNEFMSDETLNNYSHRRKAAVLLQDVAQLYPDFPSPSLCERVPSIHSYPSALGAMYVLEGSTLGGVVINRILSKRINKLNGFKFFVCYGDETQRMWDDFKENLKQPFQEEEKREILKAAEETFRTFKLWLDAHH